MKLTTIFALFLTVLTSVSCTFQPKSSVIDFEESPHPLGDNIYAEVYDFLLNELKRANLMAEFSSRKEALTTKENDEWLERTHSTDKRAIASAYEGTMSHILDVFCQSRQECRSLALYARNGLIISAGSQKGKLENASLIIEEDLYQGFQNGVLTKTYQFPKEKRTVFPVYMSDDGTFGTHSRLKSTNRPIGYIVYKKR